MKFHGMTLPENMRCPERYHLSKEYFRGACGLHQGVRHLRFARAEAAAGNFAEAIRHLTSSFFLLGASGGGRGRSWSRLCTLTARVEREVSRAIAVRILSASVKQPRRRRSNAQPLQQGGTP